MAAEMVGGAFLSASLQVLFDRLASPEVVSFLREKKFNQRLLKKLEIKLFSVMKVLNDAEEKQIRNPAVKKWLNELEDAAYEADNLLDEIATDALRFKLDAESTTGTSWVSTLLDSYNQDMENKIEKILEMLEFIVEQKDLIGLKEGIGEKPSRRQPTTSLADESVIYGRDGDKEAIIKLLLKDDHEGSNEVCVIPIVGLGGIGKTTLAQSLYNDPEVQEHFKLKSWVCVSEEFDICKVTKTVLCAVTNSPSHSYEDLDSLQTKLKEELVGKKFLIVLDDVWNEDYVNWENLRKPFKHGVHGSKIIVTTRSENVACIMQTVPPHSLGQLNDEDCWQLFAKHAFGNKDYNAYPALLTIGRKVVKKCGGLPLAAKTLGGLLRSRLDVAEWERISESEIWDIPYDKSNVLPALMLSYHYLPSPVKRCFAFCSLFPKDYKFQRHQLVSLWMAENLLLQTTTRAEDVSDDYFNELLSISFFQRSSQDEGHFGYSFFRRPSNSQESWFVMHDLVHDLSKFVSRGYCFTVEDGISNKDVMKVRHLAVAKAVTQDVSSQRFVSISKATHLRTLLPLYQNSFCFVSNDEVNNVILKLRRLRILSLCGCANLGQLSESVGDQLKHLRFLDLSHTPIKRLPNSVSMLYNLQTLNLSDCPELIELPEDMYHLINLRHLDISRCRNLEQLSESFGHQFKHLRFLDLSSTSIKRLPNPVSMLYMLQTLNLSYCLELIELPEDMCHLINLRHLDIGGCYNLKKMPRQIGDLKGLQRLSTFIVGEDNGTKIEELRELSDLHGDLSLKNLENVASATDASEARLMDKKHLEGLDLYWTKGDADDHRIHDREVLEKLLPHTNLKRLSVSGYGGTSFPKWLGYDSFCYIVSIKLEKCHECNSLPPLGQLPSLKTLEIDGLDSVVTVGAEFYGINSGRSSTRKPFASLEFLSFSWMSAWEEWSSIGVEDDEVFPMLQELRIKNCNRLRTADWPGILPSLTKLQTEGNELLVSSLPGTSRCDLVINNCERLEFPITHKHSLKPTFIYLVNSCGSAVFPLDLFPNLSNLYIIGCENLESVGVSSDGDGLQKSHSLTSLSDIRIEDCPNFISFLKGGSAVFPLDLFPNLSSLYIIGCENLESVGVSSDGDGLQKSHSLTSLSDIHIEDCPNFISFPNLPSNLTYLSVLNCPRLIAELMKWNLPSTLFSLEIGRFPDLKRLDMKGLQNLTSLKYIRIMECPELEKLPQQGLPTSVERLNIAGCPLLEKRCQRETGEDWNIISHIPQIFIDYQLI